jgi:hypothetical protein
MRTLLMVIAGLTGIVVAVPVLFGGAAFVLTIVVGLLGAMGFWS